MGRMIIMSNMTGASINIINDGEMGSGYEKNSSTFLFLKGSDDESGRGGVDDVTTKFYMFTFVYIAVFVCGFIMMVCFIHWYLRRQSYLEQTSLLEAEALCREVAPRNATTSEDMTAVSDSPVNGGGGGSLASSPWVSFVWSRRLRIVLPESLKSGGGAIVMSSSSAPVTTGGKFCGMGGSRSFKSRRGQNASRRRFSAIEEEDGLADEGADEGGIC
eukprot:1732421-Rhodomonas_salina.3